MIIEELVSGKKSEQKDLPIRMVSPRIDKLPEDDLLEFVSVTKPADLFKEYRANTVLMFDDDQLPLLQVWNTNQDIFGMQMLSVLDIPGASYDGDYTEYTTRAGKTTYHDLIGDLAETKRRNDLLAEDEKTTLSREKDRITRKSGEVKEIEDDDFDQAE